MKDQVDYDKEIVQNTTCMDLLKELVLVPANRKRIIFGVGIMVGQQLSGVITLRHEIEEEVDL
ncbi:hypothetical protein NEOLI_005463 [Neolecta irregularis DAH-3]|uniref:Uncharacterized protein n=1 Tax=Neolecta irregularis (strain DAH-3) TaxID=1198029 RepID=A0A1U7LHK7_NEOID|nr:hypothetical protein NEOLI_005463 [Neolecta irregularis DAH-3]|eukprot:OLL22032.1 hypothetical protein NEOLI_005463 [Neolecta irregularis DAH-3]